MPATPEAEAEAQLARYAEHLAGAVEVALPGWVERAVARRLTAGRGAVPDDVADRARRAGRAARDEIGPQLRQLLGQDVDRQWTTPLDVVRRAVRFPAGVLAEAGVPPIERDASAERALPDDVYDLAPAAWAEVDPGLVEPGLAWGAAKAYVVLARRRVEGRR